MPSRRLRRLSRGALLVTLAGLVFVAGLGTRAALDPLDEGYVRYAGIADAMVRSGDWAVPRLEGRIYVEKPPLIPWLVALPELVLGQMPSWGTYVPALLGAVLLAAWSAALGRRLFGSATPGLLAAVVVLTTYRGFVEVRNERLDLLFAALVTGAFHHAYVALTDAAPGRTRAGTWALAGAVLGLAVLAKGPAALLFVAGGVVAFGAWSGRLRTLASRDTWAGVGALLAVALPWPLLFLARVGWDGALEAMGATSFVTRSGGFFAYFAKLPTNFAPWIVVVPALVAAWVQRRPSEQERDPLRFLACWLLAIAVPLHLSEARHSRYLLPAYPALALLLVSLWYAPGSGRVPDWSPLVRRLRDGGVQLLLAVCALLGVAALVGLPWVPAGRVWVAAAALAAAAGASWTLWRGSPAPRARVWALGACLLVGAAGLDAGRAARIQLAACAPGARKALAAVAPGAPLRSFGLDETGRLALGLTARRPAPDADGSLAAPERAADAGDVFVVTSERGADELAGSEPVQRLDTFCLRGKPRILLRLAARGPGTLHTASGEGGRN